MSEMTVTEIRQGLTAIHQRIRKNPKSVVQVTYRGKSSVVVMSAALYDTIVETLEVMSDPEAVEALRGSLADIEAGRVHSQDEVARHVQRRR